MSGVPIRVTTADGDMNGDALVNGEDVQIFVDAMLGAPSQENLCRGDFDSDKNLDIDDVAGMVAALLA